jgi:hypothetical protein
VEVFRSQTPFLCFGKAVSLKGSCGSSSLASQGQGLPCWSLHIARSDIQCLGYRLSQREEQVFGLGTERKFTPHFLIKVVENLVWGTLMGPKVKVFFIYPYTNYISPCPIGWPKYSEIYRATDTRGAVRGSCSLVKEGYVFSPLPCGPWNTTQ